MAGVPVAFRDLDTEALAYAVCALGWQAHATEVQPLANAEGPVRLVESPAASRFAALVDLARPYEPSMLLVAREAVPTKGAMAFAEGRRTPVEKLMEVRAVNRGQAPGPVGLE